MPDLTYDSITLLSYPHLEIEVDPDEFQVHCAVCGEGIAADFSRDPDAGDLLRAFFEKHGLGLCCPDCEGRHEYVVGGEYDGGQSSEVKGCWCKKRWPLLKGIYAHA